MPKPHEILEAIPAQVRLVVDAAAAGVTVTAIVNALPSIAALLSVVWLIWQMYDRAKYGPSVKRKGRNK